MSGEESGENGGSIEGGGASPLSQTDTKRTRQRKDKAMYQIRNIVTKQEIGETYSDIYAAIAESNRLGADYFVYFEG